MTQNEFETLFGLNVTSKEYAYIERIYMAAGSLDKQTFCSEIKKDKAGTLRTSDIVCTLVMENETQQETIDTLNGQISRQEEGTKNLIHSFADFLVCEAHHLGAPSLREKAIKLIGLREYLRLHISYGFELWEEDRKALDTILSE